MAYQTLHSLAYAPSHRRGPRVSIGIPVYNGQNYIEQAIRCFLTQTFSDIEIVISDNASIDATEQICRDFAAADSRIRYYRNERNLGAASNYNRVFFLSSGKYFKWAAHDDLCTPDYIEKTVRVLDAHRDSVLCHARSHIIGHHGERLGEGADDFHVTATTPSERLLQAFLAGSWVFHPVFGLIRRSALERTNLIANYVGSDYVLLAELALEGHCVELPEYLFLRRQHPARSGNLTLDEFQQWWDPRKGLLHFHHWRLFREYVRATNRPGMEVNEKLRCIRVVLKWLFWHRQHLAADLTRATKTLIGFLFAPRRAPARS